MTAPFYAYYAETSRLVKGFPSANRQSVCGWERKSSEMTESCRLRQGEGYAACSDDRAAGSFDMEEHMENEKKASVLDLLLRPEVPDARKALPEKKVEVTRL